MTRGKHGAASTTKRLAEAEARIAELESAARLAAEAHRTEVRELKAQAQNLQGSISKQVRELSAAAVLAAKDAGRAEAAAVREREADRMKDVLRFIFTHSEGFALDGIEKWTALAALAGMQYGEMAGLSPNIKQNRHQRRLTNGRTNLISEVKRSHGYGAGS